MLYWPAESAKQKLCEKKGQKRNNCHNYITALLPYDRQHFLVCGTNAFSPECQQRLYTSLTSPDAIVSRENAITKSAFNPHWNTTTLLTSGGEFLYAGPLDFRGSDPAIIRHKTELSSSVKSNPVLRTVQSDSKWINSDASFVSSFEAGQFVYFLFRESAVEYMNCGKSVFSRIGRVCKNDRGGQLILKENWTTFLKARLNCSLRGQFPFYFDEIQSAVYVDSDIPIVYATFNTPE